MNQQTFPHIWKISLLVDESDVNCVSFLFHLSGRLDVAAVQELPHDPRKGRRITACQRKSANHYKSTTTNDDSV